METILDIPLAAAASRSPARRNLHLGHFAFMRALVHSIDVRAAWVAICASMASTAVCAPCTIAPSPGCAPPARRPAAAGTGRAQRAWSLSTLRCSSTPRSACRPQRCVECAGKTRRHRNIAVHSLSGSASNPAGTISGAIERQQA